jgi:hypothetical protein
MLKANTGYPAYGNSRKDWDQGSRWSFENPEYRQKLSGKMKHYFFVKNNKAINMKPTPVSTGGSIEAFAPSTIITIATINNRINNTFFIDQRFS